MVTFFLFFLTAGHLPLANAAAIETQAREAIMIDADTQAVLLEKNADQAMPPSSMSKLMTLYVLFQRLKEGRAALTDNFTVSEKAWRTQGSKTFVKVGNEISVENLIHGIIVQSGNDACIVVAEGISGSEEAFAAEMNRVAGEIGLTGSHFANATGLPDEQHYMTARDLAILSDRLIEDFPDYYPFFAMKEFTHNNITQPNRNRLLWRDMGVDGLKTGHTEVAGFGIALSAKQGERRLILVLNGLDSDNARVEEGDKLLRWGFREFTNKKVLTQGQAVDEAPVWMGKADTVKLVSTENVALTLPAAGLKGISFTLKYTGPLMAPVEQGAEVAELVIRVPGQQERVVKLAAAESVERLGALGRVLARVKNVFH